MLPTTTPSTGGGTSSVARIDVEIRPARVPDFAAVVSLRGEHDMATAPEIVKAISSIAGNVLVDLSTCDFVDSSMVSALLTGSQDLEREGHRLELLVPGDNAVVLHTLDLIGLREVIVIHGDWPEHA
jgi:anti-anti-sigma factor